MISVIVFTGYVWTEAVSIRKKDAFSNEREGLSGLFETQKKIVTSTQNLLNWGCRLNQIRN